MKTIAMLSPATGPVLLPTAPAIGLPVAGQSSETAPAFVAHASLGARDGDFLGARTTAVPAPVPRGAPV